jgi:hypothetical protein
MGQVAFSSPLREGVYFEEVDVEFLFLFYLFIYLFIYCLNHKINTQRQ